MLTRLFITTALFLQVVFCIGQTDVTTSSDNNEKGFINGLSFYIIPELNGVFPTDVSADISQKIGFSVGVNKAFVNKKNISVVAGVGYGLKNYDYTVDDLWLDYFDKYTLKTVEFYQKAIVIINEIQVPVIVQYNFIKNHLFVSGGFELNYRFNSVSEGDIYYEKWDICYNSYESSDFEGHLLNFSSSVGLGCNLNVSDRLGISFEPVFRYYFMNYFLYDYARDSHNSVPLYDIGLKTTLHIK